MNFMPKSEMNLVRTTMLHVEGYEPGCYVHECVVVSISRRELPLV